MRFHSNIDQGTDAWRRLRLGIPTASNFHHVITPAGKPVDSRERNRYKYKLVAERILGSVIDEEYTNHWMERGITLEDEAALALERILHRGLEPGGFVTTDDGRFGCSPDRLLVSKNSREAVEIKCPSPQVHIGHICEGPGDRYKPQVQGQLLVGEYVAVHFWSWNPQLPPVHIVTERDEAYIGKMMELLDLFANEVDAAEDFVRKKIHDQDALAEILDFSAPLPPWKD